MGKQLKGEVIRRFLAERAVEATGGIVVLFDRFLGSGLDEEVFKTRGCDSAYVRLKHPAYNDIGRTPVLFRIRPEDSDLLGLALDVALSEQRDQVAEATNGLTVSGWLETDVTLEVLAQHLAAMMEQRGGGLSKAGVFRLCDRRVLELAWEVFNTTQKSVLLGPISRWHMVDRRGHLRSLVRPAAESSRSLLRCALQVSQTQIFELSQCQQIQEMLRGWRSIVEDFPPDYLGRVRSALNGAISAGLSENQDVLLLAAYTLQIHPRLAIHPTVRASLRRSIEEQIPLMDVLAEIPDPDGWERIKNDLSGIATAGRSYEMENKLGS